jgi:cytochrome b subunit of formate dehydrogenase
MVDVSFYERLKLWGWLLMIVTVIAFVAGVGLTMIVGNGVSGWSTLPVIFTLLIGLAIVLVGGFAIHIYGILRIRHSRRSR